MTNQEVLTKAVQKALDGGFPFDRNWNVDPSGRWVIVNLASGNDSIRAISYVYEQIIFNHDFAKALWGEELRVVGGHYDTNPLTDPITLDKLPEYQYHLQQMVIAEDPIKYLGENI